MECLGGSGYVEERILPRLYREAPVNSIWEGAGNVICLDILRTLQKEPRTIELYFRELTPALGNNKFLDQAVNSLKSMLTVTDNIEARARHLVERMALCLQGALLVQHGPAVISDIFCATRLGPSGGLAYGTIPPGYPLGMILDRVWAN